MYTLPETRFDFAGDEYIFAEISRDMSPLSHFKALAITNELTRRKIPGILEICPSNASYLVRFNPDLIPARELLDDLMEIDLTKSNPLELHLSSRIVEIPTWYDDPKTREYSRRFKNKHHHPELTDFDYVVKINGYRDKESFIEAHSSLPYLITMMGFMPGAGWQFPLGSEKERTIQAPKYLSPRTDTPERAVGLGGGFTFLYPVAGPGSYQLIGRSAVPIVRLSPNPEDIFFLARPGDLWKYRSIDENEYRQIQQEVALGKYTYKQRDIEFAVGDYLQAKKSYIEALLEGFS